MADITAPRRPPAAVSRLAVRLLGRFILTPTISFEQQRARLRRFLGANGAPKGTTVTTRPIGGVPTAHVTTPQSADDLVVLHLHGGGYCVGEPAMAFGWAGLVAAATSGTVLVPDYSLAPESPFPVALDEVAGIWKELTATVAPARLVLSGDSAGAGLALALATRLRDEGAAPPSGLVLISPWLDLTANRRTDPDLARRDHMLSAEWLERAADAYGASTPLTDPGISPLLGSLAGLPPALVQTGTDDLIGSDAIRFAAGVEEAGGEVTLSIANDLWHDFPMQAGMLAAADGAVRQVAAFVARVTAAEAP